MALSNIRLGGSTFSFMWQEPALASFERMQAIGLNDFDVLAVPGHIWFDAATVAGAGHLRRQLEQGGIRIESLNLPSLDYNLCSSVPAVRAQSVDAYVRTLQLCADLGGRAVVVVPGRISGLLPPNRGDTMGWLSDSIATLLRTAERLDQRLYLESHPMTPIPTAVQIGAFVDQFQTPCVTIAYDIASAEFIQENQVAAIGRLGHRIGQFHLSDSPQDAWRHNALGQGTVDVPAVLKAIEAIGFAGITTLEIISPEPIAEMQESLRRLAALGVPTGALG